MYWPDTGTGVDTEPARKPVASAVRKYFTEGGVGVPPTVPGGDWFNAITNEVLSVLAAAGIDPSKTDDDQLLLAIQRISKAMSAREALRRTYAEAGFTLVPGSFELGGTVTTATDVLLYEADGHAYNWDGVFPGGGKVVPQNSTPATTGGVGPDLWLDQASATLRSDLALPGGSGQVGFEQLGMGSVARTSEEKIREHITAFDKGAIGDGVADDSAAFTLLESQFPGRYVDLLGKIYSVNSVPNKCFYHNGTFKVGSGFIELESLISLGASITVTVGASGDFQTINAAIKHLSEHYYKSYNQAEATPSPGYSADTVSAVVRLLSGFVMEEQVLFRQTKLGWITIIADDPVVTISRAALTKIAYFQGTASEMYPAFYAGDNSELPIIACKFQMDSTGVATNRHFAVANRNSTGHIWPYAGCLNAGAHGIYAREGSNISARLAICDGAGDTAFIAANNGELNLQGASGRGSSIGCTSTDGSTVNFAGGIADHCALYGVNCLEGSSMNASSANLTFAGQYGIRASNCDKVSAFQADASDAGVVGVLVEQGSTVAMKSGKSDRSPTGVRSDGGSTVDFEDGSAINCASRAVFALSVSKINAINATLTGAGVNGALANIGSDIAVNGANCRMGSVDAPTDIAVGNGSRISAATATGGKSIAVNTLTRDGFISF